jgi:hypothetical protein
MADLGTSVSVTGLIPDLVPERFRSVPPRVKRSFIQSIAPTLWPFLMPYSHTPRHRVSEPASSPTNDAIASA